MGRLPTARMNRNLSGFSLSVELQRRAARATLKSAVAAPGAEMLGVATLGPADVSELSGLWAQAVRAREDAVRAPSGGGSGDRRAERGADESKAGRARSESSVSDARRRAKSVFCSARGVQMMKLFELFDQHHPGGALELDAKAAFRDELRANFDVMPWQMPTFLLDERPFVSFGRIMEWWQDAEVQKSVAETRSMAAKFRALDEVGGGVLAEDQLVALCFELRIPPETLLSRAGGFGLRSLLDRSKGQLSMRQFLEWRLKARTEPAEGQKLEEGAPAPDWGGRSSYDLALEQHRARRAAIEQRQKAARTSEKQAVALAASQVRSALRQLPEADAASEDA
jgi:hypothetical protein